MTSRNPKKKNNCRSDLQPKFWNQKPSRQKVTKNRVSTPKLKKRFFRDEKNIFQYFRFDRGRKSEQPESPHLLSCTGFQPQSWERGFFRERKKPDNFQNKAGGGGSSKSVGLCFPRLCEFFVCSSRDVICMELGIWRKEPQRLFWTCVS